MDNLTYHAGITLKRFIEGSGRQPTVTHYLVAAVLLAQANEGDIDFDQMYEILIDTANYDPSKNKLDQADLIRQLTGY